MIQIQRGTKFYIAAGGFLGLLALASCAGSGSSVPGGEAGIALSIARATATAEHQQTATAESYAISATSTAVWVRQTEVAVAGGQATLTAQEQAINDLVLAKVAGDATATAVARSTSVAATATALPPIQTQVATMRTATAEAVYIARGQAETGSRVLGWLGLIAVVGFALIAIGVPLLVGWRYWRKHGVIERQDGSVILLRSPVSGLLAMAAYAFSVAFRGKEPEKKPANRYEVIPPYNGVLALPSAAPDPMVVNGNNRSRVVDKAAPTPRELAWKEFREVTMPNFATVIYEYTRENGDIKNDTTIPRWKTLADWDPDRVYINARWWTLCTNALEQMRVIKPKEQGKQTELDTAMCRNVVDLLLMVTREKLLPEHPPTWFRVQGPKNAGNSDSSEQLEQPEQTEQPYNEQDLHDAVFNLPAGN